MTDTPLRRRVARNKFHAIPTVVDGHRFASKREAARYRELRLLERAGEITQLVCQPSFILKAWKADRALDGLECSVDVGRYLADFRYLQGDRVVVEDVKGVKTGAAYQLFRLKKRLVEATYGLTVTEVS